MEHSASFELRYAGRKVIDAIELILTKNIQTDVHTKGKVRAYIADATEDCVKAKHDAIDAMMDFVSSWFSHTEKKLTLRKVQLCFPDYLKTTSIIFDLQDKIARIKSRSREKIGTSYVICFTTRLREMGTIQYYLCIILCVGHVSAWQPK
jgi:hypothetical protein